MRVNDWWLRIVAAVSEMNDADDNIGQSHDRVKRAAILMLLIV